MTAEARRTQRFPFGDSGRNSRHSESKSLGRTSLDVSKLLNIHVVSGFPLDKAQSLGTAGAQRTVVRTTRGTP